MLFKKPNSFRFLSQNIKFNVSDYFSVFFLSETEANLAANLDSIEAFIESFIRLNITVMESSVEIFDVSS